MLPTFRRLLLCTALSANAVARVAGVNASATLGGKGFAPDHAAVLGTQGKS